MSKIMLIVSLVCLVYIIYGLIRNIKSRIRKKRGQKRIIEERARSGYSTRKDYFSSIMDETMKH